MDENSLNERFPLADLLAVRKELKTKRDYIGTGGHGDCLAEHLLCNGPIPIPTLSSASLLDFQDAPETPPSFCDDPSMWNRGDYEFNTDFLARSESNQLQYIRCQNDKYARSNTLLAHTENLLLQELGNCERKKTELGKLNTECDKYKRQINESPTLQSKCEFEEEEKRNKDLKEHKRALLEVRKRIKTSGSDQHNAEDFSQHKRLQEKERAIQRTRLHCVSDCNLTTIDKLAGEIKELAGEKFRLPCIKKDNGALKSLGKCVQPMPNGVSLGKNHVAIVLPHINSDKDNLVCRAEVGNGQGGDWYSTIIAEQKDTLPDHQQKT